MGEKIKKWQGKKDSEKKEKKAKYIVCTTPHVDNC